MHRQNLINILEKYEPSTEEGDVKERFLQFVRAKPDCFERSCKEGHVTGSAFLLSPDKQEVLLTHHRKLKMWVQLGGHCDGDPSVHEVALREAFEESGISGIEFLSKEPIDIDIHLIPASSKDEAHYHYDVRYLLIASSKNFICSEESIELKWVPISQIESYSKGESLLRSFKKII